LSINDPRLADPADVKRLDPGSDGSADHVSVQLYAVRRFLAEDVDATLGRVAALGFREVEAFDLLSFLDEFREGLPRHGLTAPTAHVGLLGKADLDRVVDAAVELGIGTLIQPWTEPARWESAAGIRQLSTDLNVVAARVAGRGVRVGYHNHHFELASMLDGRHALEVFADQLSPDIVLEVDTYWAFAGGVDVPELLRRLRDRVVALHVKDGDGSLDPMRQVGVGSGALPIREIVAAAPRARRVIELDDTAGDMWEALRASRAFLLGLDGGRG
jgi:sugar phosphate isomerase/epimerase